MPVTLLLNGAQCTVGNAQPCAPRRVRGWKV